MDLHGTQSPGSRQEIRCRDCGHQYFIAAWQKSSRCQKCGNIQAHAGAAGEHARARGMLKEALLGPAPPTAAEREEAILETFRMLPEGLPVQSLLGRYQVEWQLWAMLVKNFENPLFHSAYVTHLASRGTFDTGILRYREHRSAMASTNERWQAEVADLMIERLDQLTAMRMELEGGGGIKLPDWWLKPILGERAFRMLWLITGFVLAFILFGVI